MWEIASRCICIQKASLKGAVVRFEHKLTHAITWGVEGCTKALVVRCWVQPDLLRVLVLMCTLHAISNHFCNICDHLSC